MSQVAVPTVARRDGGTGSRPGTAHMSDGIYEFLIRFVDLIITVGAIGMLVYIVGRGMLRYVSKLRR